MVDDERLVCGRCGFSWVPVSVKRVVGRVLCVSCRVRPALSVKYGLDRCVPWRHDFDELDRPIVQGVLFMPGERLCGHSDCVNGEHLKIVD